MIKQWKKNIFGYQNFRCVVVIVVIVVVVFVVIVIIVVVRCVLASL